ncbi:hypothetical protein ONZ43_g6294 [Nemania bipapillata]|uniref:Uncharacterized protein n=1 Tax=Nemania bipapillata TaxID=110536 RepID=A0ACC2I0I4_9PEZI|nr:hypothetical protein ONZ43_g6294 [Nemania bipapillata]
MGGRESGDAGLLRDQAEKDARIRFVNHCSDVKVPHEELGKYLESLAGGTLKQVEMREWLQAASEKGLHPLVREFFDAFNDGRGKLVLPVITSAEVYNR